MNPMVWLLFPLVWFQGEPVVIVVGAGGAPEYTEQFAEWADQWQTAAVSGRHPVRRLDPRSDQKRELLELLETLPGAPNRTIWLVFLGHGTFDGRTARFNLQGPDLDPKELVDALSGRDAREEWVIVQTSAASGAFLQPLAAENRIVVTSTRNGDELSFSRFGGALAQSLLAPSADLDQDEQVSLLEAFISSSLDVVAFYESDGRLVTEHALLDDNGDGKGTPSDWYEGLKLVKRAADGTSADGLRAKQLHLVPSPWEARRTPQWREQRDDLEKELQLLRSRSNQLEPQQYRAELKRIVDQLADMYREVREVE